MKTILLLMALAMLVGCTSFHMVTKDGTTIDYSSFWTGASSTIAVDGSKAGIQITNQAVDIDALIQQLAVTGK